MKNYIVRNCPAHFNNVQMLEFSEGDCNSDKVTKAYCKDVTDCLMKRIADKCKAEKDKGFCMTRYGIKEPVSQGYDLACRILKELEIEEVDE